MKIRYWISGFLLSLLPLAAAASAQVRVYEKEITIPTWETGAPQVHPVFADSGRYCYPYTLNETLLNKKSDKLYHGVFLENEYVKFLILPEIGGRLHGAVDKTNQFEWLYWQKTIKPGLIGMLGAWISGGIEWNFPHDEHRASGFMTVDHRIVKHPDGSATVWVGETELTYGVRWLVGLTLFPGHSYVRCDYIISNPTSFEHPVQLWATAATHAGDAVQAMYPGDVVTTHNQHRFWHWPVDHGVDLSWWKNLPNYTSFFSYKDHANWFGTYDHRAEAGMVHVADYHVMPGKKLWSWGSGPSGRIWEEILSDGGGPYFEPQAGAWSVNQPDYHWMEPGEVQTVHDYWYPVRGTRGFHNASKDFALNTDLKDGMAFGGVYATAGVKGYRVTLVNTKTGDTLSDRVSDIAPGRPYTVEAAVSGDVSIYDLRLTVYAPDGNPVIELQQKRPKDRKLPKGMEEPGDPKEMTQDELYRSGRWLARFRRDGEALLYYREALRRDPEDSLVNAAMGFLALKQGRWREAIRRLDIALKRDGDNTRLYFGKGVARAGLRDFDKAYAAFYRATYADDLFSTAYTNLARIEMRRGDFQGAIEKLKLAETGNGSFADIPALAAACWRHLGDSRRALAAADRALVLDPMNFMAGRERSLALKESGGDAAAWKQQWRFVMRDSLQNHLTLAVAYANAGLYGDAVAILNDFAKGKPATTLNPMVNYYRGYFVQCGGDTAAAARFWSEAGKGPVAYTLPHRLEGKPALEAALRRDPSDANAHLFLGDLLYGRGQREAGLAQWREAVKRNDSLEPAWRNLGYGLRYLKKDWKASYEAYNRAAALDPNDARVLQERDEVAAKAGVPAAERLAFLEKHLKTVSTRDGLVVRLLDLRLERATPEDLAIVSKILTDHHFHVWEGKYGIHQEWVEVNQKLGDLAFGRKNYQTALQYYERATKYPRNLEVAPRTPDFLAYLNWNLAKTYRAMGDNNKADLYLKKILAEKYHKVHLGAYYQALAQKALGNEAAAATLLKKIEAEARKRASGAFRYRGEPAAIGHYLLSLVLSEKGEAEAAAVERAKAIARYRYVRRLAIHEAQLDTAGAHQ